MKKPTPPSFFADINESQRILNILHWDQFEGIKDMNCVARMNYRKKIYWAVNGCSEDRNATNEKIEPLVAVLNGLSYNIVALSNTITPPVGVNVISAKPNVYLRRGANWHIVSYDKYEKEYKNKKIALPDIKFKTRLFSCCERKLISAVKQPKKEGFTISVMKPPCELCFAAKVYLNNPKFKMSSANWLSVEAYDEFRALGIV